ncbi:MAG: hypothetical protein AAGG56_03200 [Pseudomonadota bacterium]
MTVQTPSGTPRSTEGMVDYDRNSTAQQMMIRHHTERIACLARRLGRIEPEMRIVDYGCGPGQSTVRAVWPAIDAYRTHFAEVPIAVCHADQPGNDWNSLFLLAHGEAGYLLGRTRIRSEASVGSFYEQVAPARSVAIGLSFAASHWLHRPVQLFTPGTVWFADTTGAARSELAAIAQRDWTRFLRLRAMELRRDGFLLVSTLGAVPDAREANGIAAAGRGVYRALQTAAQGMADEKLLDPVILDRFLFGLWFLTEAEARLPFENDSVVSEAFEIEEMNVEPAPVNPTDAFADLINDPNAYADQYVGYIRAFSDSTLRTQLFGPSVGGDPEETNQLAEEFYRRLQQLYRDCGKTYALEIWHLTAVLRRTSRG